MDPSDEDSHRLAPMRRVARWLLAAIYLAAGILHLLLPHPFLSIMPRWVPAPAMVVTVTGLCEIAGAVALVTRPLRILAAIMLALYAVAVYPANIQHAINDLALPVPHLGWLYHAPRLVLQPLIVWWALFAGGVTGWPFRARR